MKKLHTLPLAAALLLASPALLASNFPLMPAVHAAAQQDTIKESTLPAKAAGDKDEERSVEAPVPWLLVEDHRIEVYDAGGKRMVYSSRPIVRVKGSAHASLACGLDTWNRQEAQDAKRGFNFAYDFKKEDRENGVPREAAYFDYSVITKWGRVDEHMVSFCSFGMSYAGGVHPMHGKGGASFDTRTGKEVPLAALVTNREALLQALAAAFHAQYLGREEELFAFDIHEQLERIHPAEKGLDTFSWYMGTRGELVFLYPPYALAPYASGDFTLTIEREDAPGLFTKAYPLK